MTAVHVPLEPPFGPFTPAAELADGCDLTGKSAIVTGGASNLGFETVKILALKGAHVVVPARNASAARQVFHDMPNVEVAAMDLLDPLSITAFASGFEESGRALDLLILSAGVMATPLFRDPAGRSEEHTSELQSLMRTSYAVFCL